MWSGPLHNTEFVSRVLEHVDGNLDKYGTSTRMKGMLTVAKEVGSCYIFLRRLIKFFSAGTPHAILLHPRKSGRFLPLYDTATGGRRVS